MPKRSDIFCSRADAAATYLEGVLSAEESVAFESHLDGCSECLREVNLQKQIFNLVRGSFMSHPAPELPPDFSRKVAVVAEGQVTGLRDARERRRFVGLVAVVSVASAGFALVQSEALLRAVGSFSLKALGIVPLFISFIQNLALGFFGVLRALCHQAIGDTSSSILGLIAVLAAASLTFISIASVRRGSGADKL